MASTSAPNATGIAVAGTDVTKVYGRGDATVTALAGVTVDFPTGQYTAVMGPSGSGKSTLMHILAGLDRPTAGSVEIGGTRIDEMGDKDLTMLRRERIGFIFQAFNLLPMLTAYENVVLPLSISGAKIDRAYIDQLMETIGLTNRASHRPSELSGGQQQRVAVARALASRPAVVFADEPTGNLDSKSSAEVLGLMRTSVDELGQTIVMVTHDPRAAATADRVVFLADGLVVQDRGRASAEEILDAMKTLE